MNGLKVLLTITKKHNGEPSRHTRKIISSTNLYINE